MTKNDSIIPASNYCTPLLSDRMFIFAMLCILSMFICGEFEIHMHDMFLMKQLLNFIIIIIVFLIDPCS